MSEGIGRREFLSRAWKLGATLVAAAGAWTSWDVLRSQTASGLGGVVKTVTPAEVPRDSAIYVRAAQGYLTKIDDDVISLWQRCPHLGCKVDWCESAGEFECPCHGSVFNRKGEYRAGPAPTGMQPFGVAVVDGIVEIDTGDIGKGPPIGPETIDEPKRGPSCV